MLYILPAPSKELVRADDRLRARDFVPRLSSYLEAFALLSIPAIAVVVMVSVMRNTTYAIRGSFYVVYLESINFTGTEIGLLMSAAGMVGAGTALLVGRLSLLIKPVAHALPLEQAADAMKLIEERKVMGKALLVSD